MALTASEFNLVRNLVKEESAIVLDPGKEYLVESRLAPLAETEGFSSLQALLEALAGRGGLTLRPKVIDAMTTNETSFYRDVEPFNVLQRHVLPEVITRCAAQRSLTVWCGAASTGQEPYTIAMVIREHFPELINWNITMLATDLSREVLTKAKAGKFTQLEVNRGLPAKMLVKYFERKDSLWAIKDPIRNMVRFDEMNLIKPWPPMPKCDIVFLRNVLIYFDIEAKTKILNRVAAILKPEGFLFLGGAETTLLLTDRFVRLPFERSGCYRLAD